MKFINKALKYNFLLSNMTGYRYWIRGFELFTIIRKIVEIEIENRLAKEQALREDLVS